MSVPCNRSDFRRFQQLAKALSALNPPAELRIYSSGTGIRPGQTYVSLELTGYLDVNIVNEAFGIKASPADDPQDETGPGQDAAPVAEHESANE